MEDMDKKRPASSDTSPRSKKRGLVNETFASVRNNAALVTMICSFLPIQDRVRLGQVDQQFYVDRGRGQIVGVYGNDCLDIKAALKKVRAHVKYEMNIESLSYFGTDSACWHWLYNVKDREGQWDEIQSRYYDKKSGYDLKAVRDHTDFGEDHEKLLAGLAFVNGYRRDNRKKLDNLTADIKKLGSLAPYNSLFDLMEKHNMGYDHFFNAEEAPTHERSEEHAYDVGDGHLAHLRPGRMHVFRDEDGKLVKTALTACSKCNKVTDDVRDERRRKSNRTLNSVCRSCSRDRTCSICGAVGFGSRFAQCCVSDCQNFMCHNLPYIIDLPDEDDDVNNNTGNRNRNSPGCFFVLYPGHLGANLPEFQRFVAEQQKYCKVHKPTGAVNSIRNSYY
jgi:hypothetical protein